LFWAKKKIDRVIQSIQIQRLDKEMFYGETGQLIQINEIWIGRDKDANNHHNWVRHEGQKQVYRISFHRWVEVEENKND